MSSNTNKRKACAIEEEDEENLGTSDDGELVEEMDSEEEQDDDDDDYDEEEDEEDTENQGWNEGGEEVDDIVSEGEDIDEEEKNEYEDEENADFNALPSAVITVKELRQKLGSPDGANALKTFLSQSSDKNCIGEYIKDGGSISELLTQLQQVDIRKGPAVDVFSAMAQVILKSMKEYPEKESELAEECREFLVNYINDLSPMLAAKITLIRKKAVLKLLTAMASVNDSLAAQLLSSLDLTKEVVNYLAEHSNPLEESSIRVLYIQFILAFIVGHSAKIINRLCEKRYWITAIFPEMKYDLFKTIDLMITILNEWVISQKDVSKNSRLHVFNSKSLMHLANLYEWNPKSWQENVKNNKIAIPSTDPWELSLVRAKIHQMLLNLCTNHKIGVIFHDPKFGTASENVNNLVQQFILGLSQPWNDNLLGELVYKILLVCPGLIKPFFKSVVSILKLPKSSKWITVIQYVTKIIEDLKIAPTFLENKKWLKIIYEVYVPDVLLEAITKEQLLTSAIESRLASLKLFSVLMDKLKIIHSLIKKPACKIVFHNNISQFLINNAPNAEIFLGCLKISFTEVKNECTLLIMDIIFTMNSLFPQLFDTVRYNQDCIKMVQDKKYSCKSLELTKENSMLILKLIKLEMLLNPQVSAKDGYENQLEDLFLLTEKSSECKPLAVELLKEILENTGLFLNSAFELTLWVHFISEDFTAEIGALLTKSVKYVIENRYEICNDILWAQEDASEELDTEQLSLDDFLNLSLNEEDAGEKIEIEQTEEKVYRSNLDLSPLLPALLKSVSEENNKRLGFDLLMSFMVHYLHTQVSVKAFNALLTKYTCHAAEKVQKYLKSWSSKPKILQHHPFADTVYSCISKYILLKCDKKPFNFINLSDKMSIELCMNQCIFTISQLSLNNQLLDENISRTIEIVSFLLPSTSKIPLQHPQLINDFHPIRVSDFKSNLAPLVISIVQNFTITIPDYILLPYINRLFYELKYAKKKKSRLESCSNIQNLLTIFSFNKEYVEKLCDIIFQIKPNYYYLNNELTPWVLVIEHLLKKAADFEIKISEASISNLCDIIIELNCVHLNLLQLTDKFYNYLIKIKFEICGNIFEKFNELFISICKGEIWYENLSFYLMETIGKDLDLPQDLSVGRAIILISSVNIKKQNYEQIISSNYREILIGLCSSSIPFWMPYLTKIVKTVMSTKICNKLCGDTNKLSNEISITKVTLNFMREFFDKAEQNELFLTLLNQWLTRSIQDQAEYTICEEICHTFVATTSKNNVSLKHLQKLDDDVARHLIECGMKISSSAFLYHLTLYIEINYVPLTPSEIKDLIWSHPKFMSLLTDKNDLLIKAHLLKLLLELFNVDKSLIKDSYVPLFLSAYRASLRESDQIILKILQLFESHGVNMNSYKPFLWGESAIDCYLIEKNSKPMKRHTNLILDYLDMDTIHRTVTHFPIQRTLEGFCLEDVEDIYDPAFILPVFNQIFTSDNPDRINPWKIFHNGAMALILASLGSNCSKIRGIACLVVQKIHSFNCRKTDDSLVWFHFVESIRQGLSKFNDTKQVPKVSCIVSTFLARASIIISNPTHHLYKKIHNFISARPVMNLRTVPEILELFHSNDQNHRLHQQWILEVLRDGTREPADLQLILNCYAFKFILDFHSCSLASKEIKVLIEELVARCLQFADREKHLLINNYSLIPWIEESGKSRIILEQLPKKLTSQFKPLVSYVCRKI